MRIQISTSVSEKTREQADILMDMMNYSLRDVVTVAIDRLYREEVDDVSNLRRQGYTNFVCVNPECQVSHPHWKNTGKPSNRKCYLCGKPLRATKGEPRS